MPLVFQTPAAQAPAPAPSIWRTTALDLRDGKGVSRKLAVELAADLTAFQAKVGVDLKPPETVGIQILRLEVSMDSPGPWHRVTVRGRIGTKEELDPIPTMDGTPSPGPRPLEADERLLFRDPAEGKDRLWNAIQIVSVDLLGRKALKTPLPPPPAGGGTAGGVAGGTPGGTVGKAEDFPAMKAVYQPPPPAYPPAARAARLQGTVRVELTIDAEGVPQSARWMSGPEILADTAMDYAMQWRFAPVVPNTKKTGGRFMLNLPFRLN